MYAILPSIISPCHYVNVVEDVTSECMCVACDVCYYSTKYVRVYISVYLALMVLSLRCH